MRDLWNGFVDLLLPPSCAACRAPAAEALCDVCRVRLPRIPESHCSLCQTLEATRDGRCFVCAAKRPPLDACLAACWYEGDAAAWIRAYKYGTRRGLGDDGRVRLAALSLETARRAPDDRVDAVVPVPLHPRRLRARGFDPAYAVARQIATARGVRLDRHTLRRQRDTPTQTGLGRRARRRNVRGAFRATRDAPARVWLVDDVVTTGATLYEAARVLRRAGARSVVALCAARTPPDRER